MTNSNPEQFDLEEWDASQPKHLAQETPTLTPNVVVENPKLRRIANYAISTVGIILGAVMAYDMGSPRIDLSEHTEPILFVYLNLAGVFGLSVTIPNIPKTIRNAR